MAVATSETSARVGMGLSIIDSSICVATITGFAAARHLRTRRFWIGGTFCTGSSTPRSPRATMIPSLTARMSSKHFTAAGFSIFDRIAARPRTSVRASFTSSGRCTKLSASQSTPNSHTNSRSSRSFSDSAASGSTTSGTFTPLRLEMVPPTITSQAAKSAPQSRTRSRILPSLTSSCDPGSSAAKISGWGRQTRAESPSASSRSSRNAAPSISSSSPRAKVPTRSFGPWRSARIAIGLSSSSSIWRMMRCRSAMPAWSPWLMLRRNTSAPASCRARIVP